MSTDNNHERISGGVSGSSKTPCNYGDGIETVDCTTINNNDLPSISKAENASASFSNNPFESTIGDSSILHQESAQGACSANDPQIAADSGGSSPGRSTHSTSNHSRTERSEGSLRPRRSRSRDCGEEWLYNTPPELG